MSGPFAKLRILHSPTTLMISPFLSESLDFFLWIRMKKKKITSAIFEQSYLGVRIKWCNYWVSEQYAESFPIIVITFQN